MNEDKNKQRGQRDSNPDPITGAPGAHPIGTGLGGAAGAAAGVAGAVAAGAAAGTAVGPVGTVVGGAVGAVIGGLAGKGIAEQINPTEEEAYWRDNYRNEPYYQDNYTWDDYSSGYRVGYEGYARHGMSGRAFDNFEDEFRTHYEKDRGKSKLTWDQARNAARAAWNRHDSRRLERYVGYSVVDQNDQNVGTLDCIWSGTDGEPEFVGVKTGWLFGKTHVVPANQVHVNEARELVRLPYDVDRVKGAPSFDANDEITSDLQNKVYSYYGVGRLQHHHAHTSPTHPHPSTATGKGTPETRPTPEQATMQLREEQVKVGKREVEAGGVRLRKIVRTEIVNQPVELRREEIVVERVPASEAHSGEQRAFNEQEVFIPLRREEAVVQKETSLREEVRVRKQTQTDRQQVTEQVRKEDVEIEETGEARRVDKDNPARTSQDKPRSFTRHQK